MFLGLVNIFITLVRLQVSPKLPNFRLHTAPDGQKSQNVIDLFEKVKIRFLTNLDLKTSSGTLTYPKNIIQHLGKVPRAQIKIGKKSHFYLFRPVWHILRFLAIRSGMKAKVGQLWGGLETSQGDENVHQA